MATVMPSGAEELLVALQTPNPRGHWGIPALIWGRPGEGKTSFVESLHRPEAPVHTLIGSIHDPTDFSGLPIYDQERQRMRFVPPDWVGIFKEDGVLFLDELTTAPPLVQAALLRVVLERTVGTYLLPKGVRVLAAANPPDAIAGGWELSPPLANRFVHIQWHLSGSALAEAFQDGFARPQLPQFDREAHREATAYWRMMTAAFLRRDPSLAYTSPADEEKAFASPRTWDYAIHLAASCQLLGKAPRPGGGSGGSKLFLNLLQGCVGSGAATAFVGFLKDLKLPNPEKVLDGKAQVDIAGLKDDELYVLFCSLSACLLQRMQDSKTDHFLDATLNVLTLVGKVNASSRVDAIFGPIRQMARGQVLQQAATLANQAKRVPEFQALVRSVFTDTLADYIKILERPHASGKSRGQ